MKLLLLFVLLVTLVNIGESAPNDTKEPSSPDKSVQDEWANFKVKFNKSYKDAEEEEYRKGIFEKSLKRIREHNKKYDAGEVSFKQGINQLADLTVNEYRRGYLGASKKVM